MGSISTVIPNLEIKAFGSNLNCIEGIITLNAWKGFQSRQGAYSAMDSRIKSDGTVKIRIGGDMVSENIEVTEDHEKAYLYLTDQQDEIKTSILTALLNEYKNLQELYGYSEEDAAILMPDVNDPFEFNSLIGLSTIHLLNVSKDGTAYVGYEFGCNWDDEHGLGVMTHKERVIEIGGADTAFLSWIAERDLNPEEVNAEIEANYKLAEEIRKERNKASKKPWWKFW